MQREEFKNIIIDQNEEIKQILENENLIQRDLPDILKFLKHPNILAIIGIRRGGKSTLSNQLLMNKTYAYVNFDDERFVDVKTKDLNTLLEALYEIFGKDLEYLIFDEIQDIEGWELFATRLQRTKRVIITGSNAKLLSGELATHLTGRYIDFVLFPFSFKEHLIFNKVKIKENKNYTTAEISELKKNLLEYIDHGGLPEVYKSGKSIIPKIYKDIIVKDAVVRYNIRHRKAFGELAKYVVSNFGGEITFNKLKNITAVKNIHTVKNYIEYLSTIYLIIVLERYSTKLKTQILAPKKVYCMDTGIANSVGFSVSENKGRLMENLVAIELFRRYSYLDLRNEIFYWKDHRQNEVDFIIKEGPVVKELIQACYDISNPDTRKREFEALWLASKQLECDNLILINMDDEETTVYKDKEIHCIPLWKWLL